MFKGKLNSSRILALLMVAAAIPLNGLTACDEGDEGKQLEPSSAECVAVRNWVAQNAGRLPTEYAELVRYPVAYRRGIFSALDPDAKSSLWKEHFQRYRDERPDLTAAQASFIERLSSSTSAELYKGATDKPAVMKGLQAEASALFDRDSLRLLAAQLGPDDAPDDTQACAAGVGSCTCNAGDDWCNWGHYCSNKAGDCSITPDGCGWWWDDPCDGLCVD
ncbi:bacteriocin fulvocin C-related protein [Sorangium sp. So ce1128]